VWEKQFSGRSRLFLLLKLCSSIVVEHLERKFKGVENVALACVYFNYKEATTTKDIIANLLKQLWEQIPDLSNEVQTLYCLHEKRQTEPNVKELSTFLSNESCRVSNFFIVLDALDEFNDAQDDSRAALLGELYQIPNARVMITGRTHVQSTVATVLSKVEDVAALPIRASNSDIRRYLDTRIDNAGHLGEALRADQKLRDAVIDGVIAKADGM
jgi:hypothetical protein